MALTQSPQPPYGSQLSVLQSMGFPEPWQIAAAQTYLFANCIGALDAAGKLIEAADMARIRVIGRVEAGNVPLIANGYAATRLGVFCWKNFTSGLDNTMIGEVCYVYDGQTVCANADSVQKIPAGLVYFVDAADNVWVDMTMCTLGISTASVGADGPQGVQGTQGFQGFQGAQGT